MTKVRAAGKTALHRRPARLIAFTGALLLLGLLVPLAQATVSRAVAADASSASSKAATGTAPEQPLTGLLGVRANNVLRLMTPISTDQRFNMQNFLGGASNSDAAREQARVKGYAFLRGLNTPSTRVAVGQSPNRDYAQIQQQLAAQQKQQTAALLDQGDLSAVLFGAGASSAGGSPLVANVNYLTPDQVNAITNWQTAKASWYGPGFYGNTTSDGTLYTETVILVAHKTLPLGTKVAISYGGRTVIAEVKDRGPYIEGRDFDLSAGLAAALGFSGVQTIRWAIVP